MKTRMTRLLTIALCLAVCVCAYTSAAYAFAPVDLEHPVSLTIYANDDEIPLAGVGFELYLIANMNEYAQFELLPAYSDFSGDINKLETAGEWVAAAAEVLGMVGDTDPDFAATSGADGLARFNTMEPGLYLVSGKPLEKLPWVYTFTPFMVSIPTRDVNDEWLYDVFSDIKLEKEPAVTNIEVVKLWDDLGHEENRPKSIYVDLLCDGEAIAAAQLHEGNSWSYTFENLPAARKYEVREREVLRWYTVSYETIGDVLVIRNTRSETVTPIPDIPATGQNYPLVAVLAGGGVVFVMAGWFILRKWGQEHE